MLMSEVTFNTAHVVYAPSSVIAGDISINQSCQKLAALEQYDLGETGTKNTNIKMKFSTTSPIKSKTFKYFHLVDIDGVPVFNEMHYMMIAARAVI